MKLSRIFTLLLGLALLVPGSAWAAKEPSSTNLGGTGIQLAGPAGHNWVNKKTEVGLKLAPERYNGLIDHIISIYSYKNLNSLTKPYDNYSGIFYLGPKDKKWNKEDLQTLKALLLPESKTPASEEEIQELRRILGDALGFKISSSKARKYQRYLLESQLIKETPDSLVLSVRIKKKGEKTKYVTASLSLVREKMLGTFYYQVAPNGKERQRVATLTEAWQEALAGKNS